MKKVFTICNVRRKYYFVLEVELTVKYLMYLFRVRFMEYTISVQRGEFMKKMLPCLLGLCVCLVSCGQEKPSTSSGSSITTGTAGSSSSSNSGSGWDGTSAKPSVPTSPTETPSGSGLQIETAQPSVDQKEASFVTAMSNLLNRFDLLNTQITQNYQLLQQYPESSKAMSDYLQTIGFLQELLQSTEDLDPPEAYEGLCKDFISASLVLSETYKEVSRRMSSGFQAQTTEELNQFELFTAEVIAVTEDFANASFALLTALGHVPQAS